MPGRDRYRCETDGLLIRFAFSRILERVYIGRVDRVETELMVKNFPVKTFIRELIALARLIRPTVSDSTRRCLLAVSRADRMSIFKPGRLPVNYALRFSVKSRNALPITMDRVH